MSGVSKMAGRVVIYSIIGCPHCNAAKCSLREKEISFTEVSVDQYKAEVRDEIKAKTGSTAVPQIYFNEVLVGGNIELQAAMKDESRWKELLDTIAENPPPEGWPLVPDDSLKLDEESGQEAGSDFVCEPDEYAKLVEEIKGSGIVSDHWKGIFKQRRTFTGQDLVGLITKSGIDEKEAVERGQHLLEHHFIQPIKHKQPFANNDNLFRLLEDDESNALNHGDTSVCQASSVNELGENLRKLILKLYGTYLSDDGRKVDYTGIGASEEFKVYQSMTMQLHRVQIEEASREEKLAFFINIYNALVIHANVVRGPPTNIWQRYKFFNSVKYIIGGLPYSLQDIENGVLRANRKGVGMLFNPFSASDSRLKVALEKHEPLIHFALVCGAKSCPPIKTYSADGIMDQLQLACQSFMEGDDVVVDTEKQVISVSKIFSWYKADFGGTDALLIKWISENMADSEKKEQLQKLISAGKYKVTFLPYDWSVNK